MSQVIPLFANPGQIVSLVVQTLDNDGNRYDGYAPTLTSVYFPDHSLAEGFPQPFSKLSTGLYSYNINIPTGVLSIGTFIASVYFTNQNNQPVWQVFSINVARPFGNSSATPV